MIPLTMMVFDEFGHHQTERRLTSHRSGDIAQARKKGGLKFLYSKIMQALVSNGWVVPNEDGRSMFFTRMISNGGPMDGVFSDDEKKSFGPGSLPRLRCRQV